MSENHCEQLPTSNDPPSFSREPPATVPGSPFVKLESDMGSANSARTRLPQFGDRLVLADKGLRVSPFCLGQVRDANTILAAFDAGINFFFITTDMHWPLYEGTRQGVRQLLARGPGIRDQIVVAGVCYQMLPQFCEMPFEELVDEIPGLGHLDILIAGAAYATEFSDRLPLYQDYRRDMWLGARAIGTTFHERALALKAIRERLVDIAFIRYNPGHAGAREDLFPYLNSPAPVNGAAENAPSAQTLLFNFKSTFAYRSPAELEEMGLNGNGSWHAEITDHYRFVLTRPEMDGILMAPRTPEQLEGIGRALAKGPLTLEEESYLLDVGGRLGIVA